MRDRTLRALGFAACLTVATIPGILHAAEDSTAPEGAQQPENWNEARTNRATTWVPPEDVEAVLAKIERAYPPAPEVANISLEAARAGESAIAGLADFVEKHRGKKIVLDITATWCMPCRKAWPEFVASAGNHTDVAYAIVSAEEELGGPYILDALTLFLGREAISFPSYAILDERGRLWEGRIYDTLRAVEGALRQRDPAVEAACARGGEVKEVLAGVSGEIELNLEEDPLGPLLRVQDYLGVFEGQTGVKTWCPESLRDHRVGIRGVAPLARLPELLCGFDQCSLHAFAFEEGDTPLLVLVPRPGRRPQDR